MRARYARWIREGIKQAKLFEVIEDPVTRYSLVQGWARSMYCYGEPVATNASFHIARAMLSYTSRRV